MKTAPVVELIVPPVDAPAGQVVVGFSGGIDSTVLLHLLACSPELRDRGLRAVHVHHGLHADADAWTEHCMQACGSLRIELHVARVKVARDAGLGPEASARAARHAAFHDSLHDGDTLALAHHRDDQAETFLLRALRGSGDGLGAMSPWRRFGSGWLWRPLLETPRSVLRAYACEHGLEWIEDPSNASDLPDRNYLRNRILPLLRERWPQADAALARSAALAAETRGLLDAEDATALSTVRGEPAQTLSIAALQRLTPARRARVLRRWITHLGLPPIPASGIAAIEAKFLHARNDARAEFRWRNAVVRRWRDALRAGRLRPPLPSALVAAWDGATPLRLPTGDTLALVDAAGAPTPARFDQPIEIRARRGGERIVLPGRAHSHALKKVLQDSDIPPWIRERLPLLVDGDGTLLAAGARIRSAAFDAWLRQRGLQLEWIDCDEPP